MDTKLVYDKQNQNWVFVIKAKSIKKFKEIQKLFHKSKIQLDFFLETPSSSKTLYKIYERRVETNRIYLEQNYSFTFASWDKNKRTKKNYQYIKKSFMKKNKKYSALLLLRKNDLFFAKNFQNLFLHYVNLKKFFGLNGIKNIH